MLFPLWEHLLLRWGNGGIHAEEIGAFLTRKWNRELDYRLRAGYYKIPCGSHVLFYRLAADGIDVVRILHERMDNERHIP
jgi:plasmid stabilization system protein ParE